MTEGLRVEVDGPVATLTLDRPDSLNALTVPVKVALREALASLAADRSVRAVILTGAGRAFCAGQDLAEREQPDAAPLEVEVRERYNPIIRALRSMDQPVIAAVNGVAAGAGASLAFACDIRLAADDARFVLAFGRIGLVPDSGATWFLPRLVGAARAAELALLGDSVSAADAERIGLAVEVEAGYLHQLHPGIETARVGRAGENFHVVTQFDKSAAEVPDIDALPSAVCLAAVGQQCDPHT